MGEEQMVAAPVSVGEWNVQVARRHEHLLLCPITRERCVGEKCEWWDVTTLECGIVAKGSATAEGFG